MVLAALVAATFTSPLYGDPWARGRGGIYLHAGATTMDATTAFDGTGDRVAFPGRGARGTRVSLYTEIGLTDAITLVVNAPYERVTSRGLFNDFTTAGAGDLDLRLRVTRKTTIGVFAAEGGAFVPLGYDRQAFPQLGTGATEPIVNAGYGTSISVLPQGFVSVQIGYRLRGGGLSDQVPYSAKLGAFFHPRLGTFIGLRGWESRGDFRKVDPTFALTAADSEALATAAEVYLRVAPRFDVNAVWSRPVRGRNSAIGNEWTVGVAFHAP